MWSTFALVAFSIYSVSAEVDPWIGGKATNPGAEFRLNKEALDYINGQTAKVFAKKVANITHAPYDFPIVNGEVKISAFRTILLTPQFVYELTKPNLVRWIMNQSSILAYGNVEHVVYTPKRTQINGSVVIKATVHNLNTQTALIRAADGKPTFLWLSCPPVKVEEMNVTFNDATLMASNVLSPILPKLETLIGNSLCTAVKNFINTDVNNYLDTFPNKPQLTMNLNRADATSNKDLFIDYSLILNPAVDSSFITFPLKGLVVSRLITVVPFLPQDMADRRSGQMMDYSLSDYTLNSLFQVAHQLDLINFTADPTLLSNVNAQNMRLKCPASETCLGNLFENATFPSDAKALVYFRSTQAPKAIFYENVANWSAKGVMEIRIQSSESFTKIQLLSAKVTNVAGFLVPKVYQSTISAATNIKEMTFDTIHDESHFGAFDMSKTAQLGVIVSPILEELINGFLSVGFMIPLPDGISLSKTQMHILPRTIVVNNDFVYSAA